MFCREIRSGGGDGATDAAVVAGDDALVDGPSTSLMSLCINFKILATSDSSRRALLASRRVKKNPATSETK